MYEAASVRSQLAPRQTGWRACCGHHRITTRQLGQFPRWRALCIPQVDTRVSVGLPTCLLTWKVWSAAGRNQGWGDAEHLALLAGRNSAAIAAAHRSRYAGCRLHLRAG